MKITVSKDYKKPLYAIGLAAVITAAAVTGCGPVERNGKTKPTAKPTEVVELAGDVAEYQIESDDSNEEPLPLITDGVVCPDEG